MLTSVVAFAAVAALLTITPGVDTMLVLRTAAVRGRRAALLAGLGVCVGCLGGAAASALGITALLAASRLAFDVLRIAGAVYLVWLGVRAFRQQEPGESVAGARAGTFRVGLTTNLLNPKVGVFYLS